MIYIYFFKFQSYNSSDNFAAPFSTSLTRNIISILIKSLSILINIKSIPWQFRVDIDFERHISPLRAMIACVAREQLIQISHRTGVILVRFLFRARHGIYECINNETSFNHLHDAITQGESLTRWKGRNLE